MPQNLADEVLYDVRLIERHISRGYITRKAVEDRRAAGPDMAEQAESIDLEQPSHGANNRAQRRSSAP